MRIFFFYEWKENFHYITLSIWISIENQSIPIRAKAVTITKRFRISQLQIFIVHKDLNKIFYVEKNC